VVEPEERMPETGAETGTGCTEGMSERAWRCAHQYQACYGCNTAFTSHGYLLREVVELFRPSRCDHVQRATRLSQAGVRNNHGAMCGNRY
jgi:hypothetical protein